jgi:hypothetical protein
MAFAWGGAHRIHSGESCCVRSFQHILFPPLLISDHTHAARRGFWASKDLKLLVVFSSEDLSKI